MYAQATLKLNPILRNGAYGIVMRGVQKCTCACASLRDRNYHPLCCIKLDMATELACGTGQLSYPLSSKVRLWEATDFSENMIAEAKKRSRSTRLHFSVQDATNLPYAPDSFDAVVISNALHIMPEPEKALAEIYRVLKPGGTLYAPTIVWGECKKNDPFKVLLKLSGFKVYHNWDCAAFAAFVAEHNFIVTREKLFPDKRTPMCYLAARKDCYEIK